MEFNEPQNPDQCQDKGWKVPIWAMNQIADNFWRDFPELSKNSFYFGFNTPPTYLESGGSVSSNITLSVVQYAGRGETVEQFATPLKESAARLGQKLVYIVNPTYIGTTAAIDANIWQCQQDDAKLVSLWKDGSPAFNAIPPSEFARAKAVCDGSVESK